LFRDRAGDSGAAEHKPYLPVMWRYYFFFIISYKILAVTPNIKSKVLYVKISLICF
jgi:hypothetical protein